MPPHILARVQQTSVKEGGEGGKGGQEGSVSLTGTVTRSGSSLGSKTGLSPCRQAGPGLCIGQVGQRSGDSSFHRGWERPSRQDLWIRAHGSGLHVDIRGFWLI